MCSRESQDDAESARSDRESQNLGSTCARDDALPLQTSGRAWVIMITLLLAKIEIVSKIAAGVVKSGIVCNQAPSPTNSAKALLMMLSARAVYTLACTVRGTAEISLLALSRTMCCKCVCDQYPNPTPITGIRP